MSLFQPGAIFFSTSSPSFSFWFRWDPLFNLGSSFRLFDIGALLTSTLGPSFLFQPRYGPAKGQNKVEQKTPQVSKEINQVEKKPGLGTVTKQGWKEDVQGWKRDKPGWKGDLPG